MPIISPDRPSCIATTLCARYQVQTQHHYADHSSLVRRELPVGKSYQLKLGGPVGKTLFHAHPQAAPPALILPDAPEDFHCEGDQRTAGAIFMQDKGNGPPVGKRIRVLINPFLEPSWSPTSPEASGRSQSALTDRQFSLRPSGAPRWTLLLPFASSYMLPTVQWMDGRRW